MATYIALLRGINVGGKNIVPMKELRELLQTNGYQNVRTYIQSGNIVFEKGDNRLAGIGELIESRFGFRPTVFVLDEEAFRSAVENNPYGTDTGRSVHFFFCDSDPVNIDFDLLNSLKSETEEFELKGKVFYVHAPDGIGRSKMVARIDKAFSGVRITARNLNTINKILAMLA